MESKVKFLGMIFDSKLSWKQQCEYIINKCKCRLNLLRCLTGTKWGASKACLLTVYRALIRSLLDYGAIALDNASKSTKATLDTIQAKALRICCGAMKGTALAALQNECGEMPLSLRRHKQQLDYCIKIKHSINHPVQCVFEDHWTNHFGLTAAKPENRSIFCNVSDFFDEYKGVIEQTRPVLSPPWCVKAVSVDLSLSRLIKKSDPPGSIKAFTLERISLYENSLCIYTDGSKNSGGHVGCSFCVPDVNVMCSVRLSDNLSVFTAELVAIKLGVEWIMQSEQRGSLEDNRSVVIFTDSLSSLQSLDSQESESRPNLVRETLALFNELKSQVTVVWIPGHSGIKGNDLADRLAKEALDRPAVDIIVSTEAQEAFDAVDSYILQKWQKHWDKSSTGSLNKTVVPIVSVKSKYSSSSRQKEVMISRLRLGKCKLNSYLYKIKCHPTGLCDSCKVPETIEHLLLNCQSSNLCVLLQDNCNRLGVTMDLKSILSSDELTDLIFSSNTREL